MCGIVGYIGERECSFLLLDGLKRLEYRGYDSAGMAVISNGKIDFHRSQGKLYNLEGLLRSKPIKGKVGIGHTRWATHGAPSEKNAHPHVVGSVAIVHNGIIENYLLLKRELIKRGACFLSETDTEVIAQLVYFYQQEGLNLEEAVRKAISRLKGSFAFLALSSKEPERLIAIRKESPLIIGLGKGEYFVASDAPALLPYTKRVIFMKDGQMAILSRGGLELKDFSGTPVPFQAVELPWRPLMAEKAGYKHFMQKEIFEQPRAISDTVRPHIDLDKVEIFFEEFQITPNELREIEKIWFIACGTSWHAGLVGKYMFEKLCRIPVEVDLASEFRYRDPIINKNMLLIPISQSGETADTLGGLRKGKASGAKSLGICNVLGSTLSRECDCVIYTHAGPEIGVASTKAFTTQIALLYLLAIYLASILNKIDLERKRAYLLDLLKLSGQINTILEHAQDIERLASKYKWARNFLYLGRGIYYPIALEGALKLKEISYIHAEAYAAGEMKHGPIALIDEDMPVMILAPKGETYTKVLGNMEEVISRRGKIIAVTEKDCREVKEKAKDTIFIPSTNPFLKTILLTIPLQLFAYYTAVFRGTDVDQPRNLAKSVTVE